MTPESPTVTQSALRGIACRFQRIVLCFTDRFTSCGTRIALRGKNFFTRLGDFLQRTLHFLFARRILRARVRP